MKLSLLLPAAAAASTASSSQLRIQHRSLLTSLGLRSLQSYTSEQCTAIITAMNEADADSSSSISPDEYYTMLSSYDSSLTGDASSFAELDLRFKAAFKSLACYCTVLGGGEGCCVGEDAAVDLSTLSDQEAVDSGTAGQYEEEICETMSWALGVETSTGTSTTVAAATTEGTTTVSAVETDATEGSVTTEAVEGSTGATVGVESTEAAVESTESAAETTGATDAPLVGSDGTMIFVAIVANIDFASYSPQPESYDETTYYDAEEVLTNVDENGILEDMQKGFVGLALDVFAELDGATTTVAATTTAAAEEGATTAPPARMLRGHTSVRSLQDISFLIGGNLTTEVEDVPCPASLVYAPEGAPCLSFTYSISPPDDALNDTETLTSFAEEMNSAIAAGDLYAKITEINPDTLVTGSGEPGGDGDSFDTTTNVDGAEGGDNKDGEDNGGLPTGAIVGIVIAVLAVPIAFLAYKSCNKDDQSTVPSKPSHTSSARGAVGATSSDDEVAGTAARTATAVALKPEASTKLGFTYKVYPDQIVIASVKEGSIFDGTPLKEGNEIISINGTEVKGMDKEGFRSLLTNLPEGNVTIIMNETVPLTILRVAAIKPEPTSKLGFTYKYIGNKIVVASVKDDGIFADTELKKGQEIVSINSKRVAGLNKDQFRGLLQSLPQGKIIISVKDIIEFSIMKIETTKPTADSKLGFMYKVLDDGIVVASVNDSGIFANTALSKGMEIVSINGKNVQKMTKERFRAYLSTIPAGNVTFVVVDQPKKWAKRGTTLTCTAVKEADDTKLGFTYKVMKDGATIESVGEYGIFASTDLAPGQEIVSVNGTPVAGKDRMEFRELLTSLKAGPVTIVVVDRSSKYETKGEVLVVEANKETDSTKLGFTYKVLKNKVTIESVKPESIFGGTELGKGQEILSINGSAVRGMSRDQFRELLTGLPTGTVRLIVSDAFKATVAKGGVLSVTAEKESDDTKLGFTYKVLRDDITIETVKDEGIFGGTELKSGQKILRVNCTSTKGMDRNAFRDLLGGLTAGAVTIDVFDEAKKAADAAAAPAQAEEPTAAAEPEEEVVAEDEGAVAETQELTPEEEARLEEVKAEVRVLVEQATPGKSADDMLAQYEGREDELLSHLRKFAERSQK